MGGASEVIPGLVVHLRKEFDGPTIASEAVKGSDLADAMAELAFAAGLRRNGTSLALSDLVARARPLFRKTRAGAAICDGFVLETDASRGTTTRCRFERHVLEGVATRGGRRLREAGRLAESEPYFYEIEVEEARVGPLPVEGASVPPPPDARLLEPLLAGARLMPADRVRGFEDELYALEHATPDVRPPVHVRAAETGADGEADDSTADPDAHHYPVLYVRRAFEKAARIARKGASRTPAAETGGLLLGRLHFCPDSRRLFGVIEDVLEAAQTEGTTYSLTFTSETWSRVQSVMRARQRRAETRDQRILGQFHGHNFIPFNQGATCDGCPSQGTCGISTAYLSADDRTWCRAVFPREPWQLSHVFGLTPRREPVSAFYGQRGAVLERRPYHVLDE